jgi:RNA polymerase sigma-70 factor (ECF subfamily)
MADYEYAAGASHFRTTMWSVVVGAADTVDSAERRRCLDELCHHYWKPVYYYIRRRGLSHEDALDHTQEYFATFLQKNYVAAADRDRGRFRTFVLVTVNRFLTKQIKRRRKHERNISLSLPAGEDGEGEIQLPELSSGETAEDDFNRRWALSLIETTMMKMKEACVEGRKRLYYETLRRQFDSAGETKAPSYRDLAEEFGVSETDVTNFLHRARNIFQKILRDEIRQSVTGEADVDGEIEALKQYLRPKG